jgi:nicotinamide-nucleotide amidase
VLFREFLVSGLRMMAASCGQVIAASWYGKAKTVTQMIAIVLFILIDALPALLGSAWQTPVFYAAWIMLIVSLVLTILSMVDYFAKSKSVFFDEPVQSKKTCERDCGNEDNTLEVAGEIDTTALANNALDLPLVSTNTLYALAQETLEKAREKNLSLGTAESLTGGFISATLTAVPGSSSTFVGGIASYAFSAKEQLLGVEAARLDTEGAVNDWTAIQMANGARSALTCDIAVAVTGIAGPGGEEPGKPVGTVWTAVAAPSGTHARRFEFSGNREEVRTKTVEAALLLLQEEINTL